MGPEWRKFPRQDLPILPTSLPNCALVSPSCGVRSCRPTEVAKNENANSQEVGKFLSRFGTFEPGSRGPCSSGGRPEHAHVESRFFFCQNGESDRQCRSQSTFEPTGSTPSQVDGRSDLPRTRAGRVEGSSCR